MYRKHLFYHSDNICKICSTSKIIGHEGHDLDFFLDYSRWNPSIPKIMGGHMIVKSSICLVNVY